MFLIALLYMIFASSFTIGKAALAYATPIFFVGVRFSLAGILLLGYVRFFDTKNWKFSLSDFPLLIRLTFLQVYIRYILGFIGLQYVISSKASLFFNFAPLITAVLSYWVLSEHMSWKKIISLVIGFIGIVPIIVDSPQAEGASIFYFSYADVVLLLSVVSYAYGWLILKELVTKRGYSPLMANGFSMFMGGASALITSLIVEKGIWGDAVFLGANNMDIVIFAGYTIVLVLTSNIIFYNLYPYLLRSYSATFLSFAGLLTPLFVALYGYIFLNEMISSYFFTSLFFLMIGLFLFYKEEVSTH